MQIAHQQNASKYWSLIELCLPWLLLGFLLLFTYARFFEVPYVGFDFNPSNGQVVDIFIETTSDATLHRGDQLIQVGSVSFESYRKNSRQALFEGIGEGHIMLITVQRGDQRLIIPWTIPGPNLQEILDRMINVWWLSYVFWLTGTATTLFVRPRDTRWLLFIFFFFLTAIWLITGSLSTWSVWKSAILFRVTIWLCLPVYLHLHWVFPKSLTKIPALLLWIGYLFSIGLALGEWFQVLTINAFFTGFTLAALGSFVLLGFHFVLQPLQRRVVVLLIVAIVVAFMPSIGISISRLFAAYPRWGGGVLLSLPIIPLIYFYIIFRRQLVGMELRANRLISSYLFLILLGTAFTIFIPLANVWIGVPYAPAYVGVSVALLSGLLVIIIFPRFERWVDYRLLSITLHPSKLLETYSSRITTSIDEADIIHLLRDEILPSLLIRQSALLQLENNVNIKSIYKTGVDVSGLPMDDDVPYLLAGAGKYRPPDTVDESEQSFQWVRLVFRLDVGDKLLGFWLLGRKDPDDYYSQSEISTLRNIANQTSVALVNAEQSNRLRELYQSNIERHEGERIKLAQDLHDEILNQMAVLSMNVDRNASPNFQEHYQTVTDRLRQLISGLRPAMLDYGLRPAIEELTDELSERVDHDVTIVMDLPPSDARYGAKIEDYIYRIVQQACENALQHAHAKAIRIYGNLTSGQVALIVEDDGIGVKDEEQFNFDKLLANKHFGLAGMYERATIIGAELKINSSFGRGTRVSVAWHPDDKNRTQLV